MAGYGLDSSQHLDRLLKEDLLKLNFQTTIINASVSGDTSSGGLNRLNWSLQDDYDLFILGLGANDMLRGINPEVTKNNLINIIKTVLDKKKGLLNNPFLNNFNFFYCCAAATSDAKSTSFFSIPSPTIKNLNPFMAALLFLRS